MSGGYSENIESATLMSMMEPLVTALQEEQAEQAEQSPEHVLLSAFRLAQGRGETSAVATLMPDMVEASHKNAVVSFVLSTVFAPTDPKHLHFLKQAADLGSSRAQFTLLEHAVKGVQPTLNKDEHYTVRKNSYSTQSLLDSIARSEPKYAKALAGSKDTFYKARYDDELAPSLDKRITATPSAAQLLTRHGQFAGSVMGQKKPEQTAEKQHAAETQIKRVSAM